MASPSPETHGAQSVSVEVPGEREDRTMLGQEEKPTRDRKMVAIYVLSFLVLGLLAALIAVAKAGSGGMRSTSPSPDPHPALTTVEAFYAAVDNKDLDGIAKHLDEAYVAFFGPGCNTIGGATLCNQCKSNTLNATSFVSLIKEHPPRTNKIERNFVVHGSSVMNHYKVEDPVLHWMTDHGAVVHVVTKSASGVVKLAESFWYADE
mmetsp:Transcript_159092/g.296401  ORF Transcript_159092/g.296401 Transcript_159092/m.296401 type:complete len:206 (-) Transcript_159092:52-669(-)